MNNNCDITVSHPEVVHGVRDVLAGENITQFLGHVQYE